MVTARGIQGGPVAQGNTLLDVDTTFSLSVALMNTANASYASFWINHAIMSWAS